MKRLYLIMLLSVTFLLALSVSMVGQADAVYYSDRCIVDGSGTLPNGDRFSGYVGPDENRELAGTWEHWQTCEAITCDNYAGSLQGLCNAYCEAMNCAGDAPEASDVACERVRKNFFDKGGERLPCEPCGNHFVGNDERMFCSQNGKNYASFWGTGTWNGEPGYEYGAYVEDFGDSGTDWYEIFIYAPDGTLVLFSGDFLSGGNITIPYFGPW